MNRFYKAITITALFFTCLLPVKGQLVSNLYFLDNSPLRHSFNPALQPLNNFYIGLPVLSSFQFGLESSVPYFSQAGFIKGQTVSLLTDKAQMLAAIHPGNTWVNASLQTNLLNFGFRYNSNYWTFALTEKLESDMNVPYSAFDILFNGFELTDDMAINFHDMSMLTTSYTEAALGYSKAVSDKFSWGARLKFLMGNTYAEIPQNYLDNSPSRFLIASTSDQISGSANVNLISSSPYGLDNQLNLTQPSNWLDIVKPVGFGGAIDLGIDFKPLPNLKFALAVNDLGVMQWNNVKRNHYSLNFNFDEAAAADWMSRHPGFTEVPSDSIWAELRSTMVSTETDLPAIRNYLSPSLNFSAELGVWDNRFSLGVLSNTRYINNSLYERLTTAINIRPANWMNLSFSYTLINDNYSNVGLGISARVGRLNIFASADYVPIEHVNVNPGEVNTQLPSFNMPMGLNSNKMNFAFGANLVFGTRQDADGDGISDRFDRCPLTPAGVKVDRRGCPVDKDKDGVPDYLDLCPNTPAAAIGMVGADGCELDSDGDGVPDYLDRCPQSPPGSAGFVDSFGCPVDKDQDGVLDYMDSCLDTPLGIEVDSIGCPIDTDGDGVPDYLDLCPETPLEARGFVDVNGCLIDSDDDGVPDYLDLCPNTPLEARGFVDINGCLVDADDDGVPDYRDDCLDTPMAARGSVDERGCPKDTDKDGVPDYLDYCPEVPGPKENNGCPRIAVP